MKLRRQSFVIDEVTTMGPALQVRDIFLGVEARFP
jgi:hypothetical protein